MESNTNIKLPKSFALAPMPSSALSQSKDFKIPSDGKIEHCFPGSSSHILYQSILDKALITSPDFWEPRTLQQVSKLLNQDDVNKYAKELKNYFLIFLDFKSVENGIFMVDSRKFSGSCRVVVNHDLLDKFNCARVLNLSMGLEKKPIWDFREKQVVSSAYHSEQDTLELTLKMKSYFCTHYKKEVLEEDIFAVHSRSEPGKYKIVVELKFIELVQPFQA